MNLKKYNESTGTWDIISSGNASGIMVTDPHFLEEGQTFKSVNQVLVDMDDKVEETKRNLSWVVLNGTIGGGGGGGGTVPLFPPPRPALPPAQPPEARARRRGGGWGAHHHRRLQHRG